MSVRPSFYDHQHLNGKQIWIYTHDKTISYSSPQDAWVNSNVAYIKFKRCESISYSFYPKAINKVGIYFT